MLPATQPPLLARIGRVAEDVRELARVGVEQRDPGARQVTHRPYAHAGDDLAPELLEHRDHRAPDGLRAAACDRPAARMPGGDQHGGDTGRPRRVEGCDRMRGDATEQRRTRTLDPVREA